MSIRRPHVTSALLCMAAASFLLAGNTPTISAPPPETVKANEPKKAALDPKVVQALIAQLADDSFDKRQAADRRLSGMGEPALPLLRKTAKESTDPEVRERAVRLVREISQSLFVEVRRFTMPPVTDNVPWVTRVAVSPNGKLVVAAGSNKLRSWNLASGKEAVVFEQVVTRNSWSLAFSPDGRRLIAGNDDHVARIFDMQTGKLVQQLVGHTDSVWAAALLADGKRALTGSWDKSLRLWDVDTGKEIRVFPNVNDMIRCLAVSPDGKLVAAGHFSLHDGPGTVRLWDLETAKEIGALEGHKMPITSICFSADGKRLLTSGFDSKVTLWDLASGTELQSFTGHTRRVETAAFTPDGNHVVSCGSQGDASVCLWDVVSGTALFQTAQINDGFANLAVVPGQRQCVTAGRDGVVRLWQWKR